MTSIGDILIKSYQLATKFINPASAVAGAALGLGSLLAGIGEKIDRILALVNTITVNVSGTADFTPLGLANYVLPIDQLIGYLSAYMSLLVVCSIIRIIKSWVPTVAS